MIVAEALKARLNKGLDPNLFFYRDTNGNEVDLIYKRSHELIPIEIKSAKTLNRNLFKGIDYFKKISTNAGEGYLIYSGDLTPDADNIKVRNFIRTFEIFE
jgi:predicted AAA+ superfamily ATPase